MPQVVEVDSADDSRDVIHQAVEALAEGRLVGFPTDTVYTVAAHALSAPAVAQLAELQRARQLPSAQLSFKCAAEAQDYIPELPEVALKFARRCWPGPIVLVADPPASGTLLHQLPVVAQQLATEYGGLAMRVVPHPVMAAVLRLLPGPLVLSGESPDWKTAADLVAAMGDQLELVLDQGPCRYGQPSTVIRIDDNHWRILVEGVVSERVVNRLSGTVFLFICTGNTCRSPMAEGMFRKLLADKLKCSDQDLMDLGYIVQSAGLAAGEGHPASPESVEILATRGVDLHSHLSQPVSPRLLQQADYVFTMTRQHRDIILREFPNLPARVEMLDREGDVLDPIGFPADYYEKCADQIERNLQEILADFPRQSP